MNSRVGSIVLVVALVAAAALALINEPGVTEQPSPPPSKSQAPAVLASTPSGGAPSPVLVASLERPKFAWPAPAAIEIVEHSQKGEGDATTSYVLEVCPRGSDHLVVTHKNLRFERLQGRSPNDPEIAAAISQVTPLLSVIPAFVVDSAGALIAVEGIDEALERMALTMSKSGIERVREAFREPAARSVLAAAIGDRWQAWVGLWALFDPKKGAKQSVADMVPESGPPPVNLGGEVCVERIWSPKHVLLSFRKQLHGEQAKDSMQALLKTLEVSDLPVDQFDVSATYSIDAELEWPALRPKKVHTRKVITVKHEGQTKSRVEDHEYTFKSWTSVKPACSKSALPTPSSAPSTIRRGKD